MPDALLQSLSEFHFLRPLWFFGLLPAALLIALQFHNTRSGNWSKVINPALLPYLIQGEDKPQRLRHLWLLLAWIFCCLALAGPTWQKLPQPVVKEDSALVILFDLSPSMLAEDIKPSRLVRARYKLIDLLKQRSEGVTGLVVYSGDAHVLSPLTDDTNTIISLAPVLSPGLMPEYGSNIEQAVEISLQLLKNAGYSEGNLILISDEVPFDALLNIEDQIGRAGKFRLSVLGVGTEDGAPIPLGSGGFVKDRSGAILIPKLNRAELQLLAANSNGLYRTLGSDDSDIRALLEVTEQRFPDNTRELDREFDQWLEQGHWLVLLILPIALLCFRRGVLACLLLAPLLHSPEASAFGWSDLWQTRDQQGAQALAEGDPAKAQALFEDNHWKGAAAYRAGDMESAVQAFGDDQSASGHYNRGNALARGGDLEGAIQAYDQALKLAPDMEDAQANKALVEALKNQQQEQQQNQQGDGQNSDQQQGEQQNESDQNHGDQSTSPQNEQGQSDQSSEQQPEDQSASGENPESQQAEQQSPEQAEQQAAEQPAQDSEGDEEPQAQQAQAGQEGEEDQQKQQELEQWLRRVPDDPSGLLRNKFRYQSQQRALQRRLQPPTEKNERW